MEPRFERGSEIIGGFHVARIDAECPEFFYFRGGEANSAAARSKHRLARCVRSCAFALESHDFIQGFRVVAILRPFGHQAPSLLNQIAAPVSRLYPNFHSSLLFCQGQRAVAPVQQQLLRVRAHSNGRLTALV